MWRKLKIGGKGRGKVSKGICCCDRKVVIWEFSPLLLPNKSEWAIVYSPEALYLHSEAICTHCTNELDLETRAIPYGGGSAKFGQYPYFGCFSYVMTFLTNITL